MVNTKLLIQIVLYLIVASMTHEPVTGNSDWVNAVWGFMTFKWAFGCVIHMFHYHFVADGENNRGFSNI
jgi:hypothetical protein